MSKHHHKIEASKSLNKTITETMTNLGEDGERPKDHARNALREKFGNLAESQF